MGESNATPELRARYLVIPGFYSPEEAKEMYDRAHQLLDDFSIEGHPLVCDAVFPCTDVRLTEDHVQNGRGRRPRRRRLLPQLGR